MYLPRQSPRTGNDVGHRGHGPVRPVAAHDAVKEGRPPARRARSRKSRPPSSRDELGVVEPVRAGNVEIVVLKSVVVIVVVIIIVFLLTVVLMLDHVLVMIEGHR